MDTEAVLMRLIRLRCCVRDSRYAIKAAFVQSCLHELTGEGGREGPDERDIARIQYFGACHDFSCTKARSAGRIVIAESCYGILLLLGRAVARHGWRVLAASTSSKIRRIVRALDYDFQCLITDLHSADINGLMLAMDVWTTRPDIPVLFLSLDSSRPAFPELLDGHRTSTLCGPFNTATLLSALEELINHRAAAAGTC